MQVSAAWMFLFAIVVVCPMMICGVWIYRSPYNVVQSIFCFLATVLVRFLWRADIENSLPIPPGQGGVLISNHRSSVDPFFVQVSAGRVVHWMVAKEYCEHPAFRWFLTACEVIPVNRGGIDTASTKQSIRLASAGGVIGMFPEGRINMTDDFMMPCRPGAVMIALKARVPIIPVYIEGSPYAGVPWSPFCMRARVKVRYGDPICLSSHYDHGDDSQAVAQLMVTALEHIAQLGGQPNHQPRLAGRHWKPTAEELAVDTERAAHRATQ